MRACFNRVPNPNDWRVFSIGTMKSVKLKTGGNFSVKVIQSTKKKALG